MFWGARGGGGKGKGAQWTVVRKGGREKRGTVASAWLKQEAASTAFGHGLVAAGNSRLRVVISFDVNIVE